MNIRQSIRIALFALMANKLRAVLTMLGIIIGVGAVVGLLAIGNGARGAIIQSIEGIGANLILVLPGSLRTGTAMNRSTSYDVLTVEDAEAIARPGNCINCAAVAPQFDRNAEVVYRSTSTYATITGTTPDFQLIRNFTLETGQFFTNQEVASSSRVAAIGADIAEELFGPEEPLGRIIRINRMPFRVIGVFERQGAGAFGYSRDHAVVVPLTAAMQIFRRDGTGSIRSGQITTISVSAVDSSRIEPAIDEITQILRQRHRISYQEDDFSVTSLKDIMDVMSSVTNILTVFLAAIAAISLLVGGIGIMNIMLVSVMERTREIGLRKAVGARERDIMVQFLIEAVILSLAGGIIGIAAGGLLSGLVSLTGAFATRLSLGSILLAAGFSVAVGLFFGIYPARRAARLNPIDALRYE
ncbi:MAG: ABC transporter permease [Anaerolineae bacterium]